MADTFTIGHCEKCTGLVAPCVDCGLTRPWNGTNPFSEGPLCKACVKARWEAAHAQLTKSENVQTMRNYEAQA